MASSLDAQQALENLARADTAPSFAAMQRAFIDWSRGRDLSRERGWKWYRRWEAFTEQRAMPGGRLADARTYWLGATEALAARTQSELAASSPGWMPVGPSADVISNDPSWVSGLGRINCVTFHPTDSNTFWVGVGQGGVWKTVDGGRSWTPLTDELPILRISDIAVDPNNTDVLYISVGDYGYLGVNLVATDRKRHTHYGMGVFKSTDGGETWAPTGLSFALTQFDGSLIRRVFVHPADSRRLLAVGTGGTWTSEDAGATWTQGRTDLISDAERDPSDPNVIVASTGYLALYALGDATVIRSTDFGATWSDATTPIPPRRVQRIELAFSASDPTYVYAVACNTSGGLYGVYRSTDGGVTWSARAVRPNTHNILGWDMGIDQGNGQGTYDLAITVDPTDRERLFVGGINVWGSEDGGSTWNGVSYWVGAFGASIHGDQHFFAVNPLTNAYFVCNDGGIHTTHRIEIGSWDRASAEDDYEWPTRWTTLTSGMAITSFYRIGLSRDNAGYVVGGAQDNATFYFDGAEWRHLFGGDGMDCFIDPVDPRRVYGSSQFGWLHMTDDGGETDRYSLTRQVKEVDEGEWTTPFVQDPEDRSTIYAGFGDLWRSQGDDEEWERVSRFDTVPGAGYPTPTSALAVSVADPDYIYLAKKVWYGMNRPAEMWMTSDRGANWNNVSAGLPDSLYPTSVTIHSSTPAIAWVTFGGFVDGVKVYRTTDAGATWSNLSSDLPNLPVNAVVHDPHSSLNDVYIGTDIGVYYTNDEMSGWVPYSLNLPNVIVSDLEIHKATRQIYAATFGRGVWVSALPEIASVGRETVATPIAVRARQGDADGSVVVELESTHALDNAVLEIVDILGRRVDRREIVVDGTSARATLEIELADGHYFARVTTGDRWQVVRFTIGR